MKYVIRNTTTGTAWVLPQGTKMPKGQYVDLSYVETLPKEWQEAIKLDIKANDATMYMNEHFDMKHHFIVEKQSVYTKDAITLESRCKDAKRKAKRKGG